MVSKKISEPKILFHHHDNHLSCSQEILSNFSGLEISDVLKIDDKDYSITFSLYFNVQWSEPRLNLSREFLDTENITAEEDQLVPGKQFDKH